MQPLALDIEKLALYDPISAYAILKGIPPVPVLMNVSAIFSSFAVPQPPVIGNLDTTIAFRTWIDNVTYSLSQPNVFAGNVFKTTSDANLRYHPGVSVTCEILAGPKYTVSENFVPLENFAQQFISRWFGGWVLYKQQSIKMAFQLTDPPPTTDPNAPPYNVTVTFSGWQFLDYTVDEMDPNEAVRCLNEAGIKTLKASCYRDTRGCAK